MSLKLKVKPAKPAHTGVISSHGNKRPCVFKAKPASKSIAICPTNKLKRLIAEWIEGMEVVEVASYF